MKFEEALKAMREGKKVKRKQYNCCFFIKYNKIFVTYQYYLDNEHTELKEHFWLDEITAEDWEIINE